MREKKYHKLEREKGKKTDIKYTKNAKLNENYILCNAIR